VGVGQVGGGLRCDKAGGRSVRECVVGVLIVLVVLLLCLECFKLREKEREGGG
jgi:hypothetical protein